MTYRFSPSFRLAEQMRNSVSGGGCEAGQPLVTLPTTQAVAAWTRGGHDLGGVAHGGFCLYIRIANTHLILSRHCHKAQCNTRRLETGQPLATLPTTKRSLRRCEADKSAALRPAGGFMATG
jgi:hypothetical protein